MADGRPAVGPARAQTWRCVLALAAVHAIIPPAGGVSAPGGPRLADVPGPRALQQRRAGLAGAAARRDGRSHVLRARGGATQGDFGPVYDASAVGGIGISLGSRNGQLVVARLTPGWPAAESGKLAVGDIVTEIDDQLVYGKSALEVTQMMRGAVGSPVSLVFQRGDGEVDAVGLTRAAPPGAQAPPGARTPPARAGVGIALAQDLRRGWVVSKVAPGSAAATSGLVRPGDQLVSIQGRVVGELEKAAVMELIRGPAGSAVVLGLRRGGQALDVELARAEVRPPTAAAPEEARDAAAAAAAAERAQPSVLSLLNRAAASTAATLRDAVLGGARVPRSEMVGVGLEVAANTHGDVAVCAVAPGLAADRDGRCEVGDVLAAVDGSAVSGLSAAQVQQLLLGAPGTAVSLALCRWHGEAGEWEKLGVLLERVADGPPPLVATHPAGLVGRARVASGVVLERLAVDEERRAALRDMGFSENAATRALLVSRGEIEGAVAWLAAREGDPELDTPLDEATALSAAEAAAIEEEGGRLQLLGAGANPVQELMALGFTRPDVEKALRKTQGRVMMAADRLFEKKAKREEAERKAQLRARGGNTGFFSYLFGSKEVIS